jgi:hypothetical protein
MLEFLGLLWWLIRFFASYPFSWLAHAASFLAYTIGGYRSVINAAVVEHRKFGYAVFSRSQLHGRGRGKWTPDIDEAEAALRFEINRAVAHFKDTRGPDSHAV